MNVEQDMAPSARTTDEHPEVCRHCLRVVEHVNEEWEECPDCEADREAWEANTPEYVKLGMRSPNEPL